MTVQTTQTEPIEVLGSEIVNRSLVDGAGFTFVRTDAAFTEKGRVESWFGFSDVTIARAVTPLIFTEVNGEYVIKGVGAAQTFSERGFFEVNFDLVSGTDIVEPGDLLGWTDAGTGAVIPYNTFGGQVRFFSTGFTPLAGDVNLGAGTATTREYSIAFAVSAIPIPEPTTAIMAMLGLAGLGIRRRRQA